jgi:hypothetical protein
MIANSEPHIFIQHHDQGILAVRKNSLDTRLGSNNQAGSDRQNAIITEDQLMSTRCFYHLSSGPRLFLQSQTNRFDIDDIIYCTGTPLTPLNRTKDVHEGIDARVKHRSWCILEFPQAVQIQLDLPSRVLTEIQLDQAIPLPRGYRFNVLVCWTVTMVHARYISEMSLILRRCQGTLMCAMEF